MHRASLIRVVPVLLSGLFAACGQETGVTDTDAPPDTVGDCDAMLQKGQLVITEIMPDPAGADDDSFEWFEIYNPTDQPISLAGLGLESTKIDGSSPKGHLIKDETLMIEPGAYLVFGKAAQDTKPAHVDYGYAADLGSMSNSEGKIRVVCGKLVVDDALFEKPKDGYSRSFGGKPPDAISNDDLTGWCLASGDAYAGKDFGTPGTENPDCPLPEAPCGQCYESDLLRATKTPQPGQLVITEVMPNASTKTDSTVGEWFEVLVTEGTVDLNCLQFGGNVTKFLADPTDPEQVLNTSECLTYNAGSYIVFAEHAEWEGTDFESNITLVDSASDSNPTPGVYLAYDGKILDEAHYTKTTDGVAWSLDPDALTSTGNDDPINWCLAVDPFAEGDLGTPGSGNPQCPEAVKEGTCIDGTGNKRDIDYAAPGELLVTEFLTDPALGDGTLGEWIELYIGADLDLNGMTFGKSLDSPYATVSDVACLPILANSYVLIAKSADPAENGGLPVVDWWNPKVSLTNDASNLVVGVQNKLAMTSTELDATAWATTADGKARQFPAQLVPAAVPFDTTINDDPTQWCDASQPFGLGDLGTPRAENLGCEVVPPMDQCTDPITMMPRPIVHPVAGDLLLTEIHPDPDALIKSGGAGEPAGEWFELYAATAFDLNGLELGNTFPTKKHTVTSAMCLPVVADSYVLLAQVGKPLAPPNPDDLAGNGGLPTPRYAYTGLSLSNTGGSLYVGLGDLALDTITSYPKPAVGKATQLGDEAVCITAAPLDTACNDDFAKWCAATTVYGLGDFGTPQAQNVACGGGNMDPMCLDTATQMTRPIVAPKPGDLVINEFLSDPTIVTDANGEWFELAVLADVDLNDLKIINKPNVDMATLAAAKPLLVSPDCLRATAGSFVLFAHNADPMINGNLPPVDHVVSTSLGNASGGITIGLGDVLLHTTGWALAQKAGKSAALDPDGKLDPMNTSADGPPWCTSVDAGTPKLENPQCP